MKTNVVIRHPKVGLGLSKWVPNLMKDTVLARFSRKKGVVQFWRDGKWVAGDWPDNIGYVFRWGWTGNLPRPLNVINQAKGIHKVADKRGFRWAMQEYGPLGLTPYTCFDVNELHKPDDIEVILRTATHAQGRGLWHYALEDDIQCEELVEQCEKLGEGNYYINQYYKKTAEYRVFVVCGRVVWVAQKTPGNPDDVAWNVAKGGRFDNVRWGGWPLDVCEQAIKAFNLTGLDFAGIDIMCTEDGPLVLEANSAPSQTSPYRQSCTAKAFNWIIEHGRDHMPTNVGGKYLTYIHPALDAKAKL